jgi:hypothetical protein
MPVQTFKPDMRPETVFPALSSRERKRFLYSEVVHRSPMHHPRRSFLRVFTLAGCAAGLNLSSRAAGPVLPAGLVEAIHAYGDIRSCKRSQSGFEVGVQIRTRHNLAEGFGSLHQFGRVRAGGNDLRIEAPGLDILLRHTV